MRRFRPTDPATAALGGHQASTVLCDPPPADRPGAIRGAAAVRRPVSGTSNTGTGSVHEEARRWSAAMATLDAGVYAWRPYRPARCLLTRKRAGRGRRSAGPGDSALNFCPSTTGQHGLGHRLGTRSWHANVPSIARVFGGARDIRTARGGEW